MNEQFYGKTIMIVDDNEGIFLFLKSLLEDLGFTVVTFSDPRSAISYIKDFRVDCILSDYNMPGMNGVRLLTFAKECHPGVKALLMSSNPYSIEDNNAHFKVIEKYENFFENAVDVICSECRQ